MKRQLKGLLIATAFLYIFPQVAHGQRFLMDLVDTTNQMGKGMLSIYERYNRVRLSGYIQPQFQYISKEGAESFAGGNFSPLTNNRFMLRRGRLRVDYAHLNDKGDPTSYFVFQFDGTERGVAIRDFWGRFYENKLHLFSITTGMFARPFGHEVNLSSANRESPERGRMSQILMKTERDIGIMLSLSDRNKGSKWANVKFDVGVFNGQGMSGPVDYDSHKDVIARLSVKPTAIRSLGNALVSAGVSGYAGGIVSRSEVIYKAESSSGRTIMRRDSSDNNNHKIAPRNYAGADFQIEFPHPRFATELRAEYIAGMQTGTANTSETPGTYPVTSNIPDPLYIRKFDGAYFYFLQNLGNTKHQLVVKYDWYDPNKRASGMQLTREDGYTNADMRYNTLGSGYVYTPNESLKFVFYYEFVRNEHTGLTGATSDISDDVFTARVQFNF